MGYSLRLTTRVLLYAPSHRQDSTCHGLCYTSREALAGTRNSSVGSPHEGSIRRPIAPWANALTTELHLAPRLPLTAGARCSSVVRAFAHSAMGRWIDPSGVNPLSYFSFQPVLHNWCNKSCGMCYPVCGRTHIKEPLLLIGKSSPCGGSVFPLSLPLPYVWRHIYWIKTIKIMCLINGGKNIYIFAINQLNRCSHLSAFDQERHLVSWLHIKFCDVGAGQIIISILFSLYLSSCENGFKIKRLQDIGDKLHFINKLDRNRCC